MGASPWVRLCCLGPVPMISFLMLCSAYEAATPMTSSIASLLAGMNQYRLSKFGSVSV